MSGIRIKDIKSVKEVNESSGLKKTLTAFDLVLLGIGAVIGTGVFVFTGIASKYTGPALCVSFLLSGIVCMFVALAYTEVGAMIPTSGSVYTYSYVALGEFAAWMTSWLLILEFSFGSMAVASGWSGYVVDILKHGGVIIPHSLTVPPAHGGIMNLPAFLISAFITLILVRGTKESTLINNILVFVKLAAIFIFIVVAAPSFTLSNWENFAPYGFGGIATGAAVVFIAFAGFDSIAASAEECKNPKRDVTIGLIVSLLVCTVIYMLVAALLTGIVPFTELNNTKPLAHALRLNGSNIGSALVAVGGIAGMTTVILVQIYAQSRVFYVMSRDGLLPKCFSSIHPRFSTPHVSTLVIGMTIGLVSAFVPVDVLGSLTSMGTLSVFMIASVVVMVLRKKFPDAERPFKCPAVFVVSSIAVLLCTYLLAQLIPTTVGKYYGMWLVAGAALYFAYGYRTSKLNAKNTTS